MKPFECGRSVDDFECTDVCGYTYSCGFHKCGIECHGYEKHESICVYEPSVVTHCACSKTTLEELGIVRIHCTDEIPKCDLICGKQLKCGHLCKQLCHSHEW